MTMHPTPEGIREFVLAAHGDLARVQAMLAETPELLNRAHEWKPGDTETAIQAAAHVGNREIALYLLARGAPLEISTAAMLGEVETVREMLQREPALAQHKSAHGIPLLPHAALSSQPGMLELVFSHGALEGSGMALSLAVGRGDTAVARWLLEHARPDLGWKNFQGKTVMDMALEAGHDEMVALLRAFGGRS
ncbi:ankyrin repeat domain-containing protein [Meiothermus ruber]|uniref:ankyrin repeat domain-containing protein n=1 Tax=Meiothermus ruber TaxID=277 RepID=UPI0003D5AB5F|nr:ankyrin repeat domain-containing protein [Meiothermus ruber]GAO76492.1 putative uncharacterized protein [Meiothermus ruber H328]